MPSIFVFNIISKSKNLETDILSHFGTLKLDLKKPLPWKGFTVRGEASELICEKNSESILRFTYAKEEEKEFISLSGTKFTNRVKDYRAVWVDPLRQLLLIFTHDAGIAFNIVKEILSGRNCPFKLSTIKYEL